MKRISLFSLIFIAGCSTTPVHSDSAHEVPSNRYYQPEELRQHSEAKGKVVIKRDRGVMGSPCYMTIFIDGERIAQLAPGEKLTFYPNPGEYIFGSRPNDPCTGSQQEIEANVKAGKLLTYRIGYGGQADSFINRTTD